MYVEYLMKKSLRHKTPGYDLITAEVAFQLLKKALLILTYFIFIFGLTYIPVLGKFSIINMIPKSGKPPDSLGSYRLISVLSLSPNFL
jgi:hypothetical protein